MKTEKQIAKENIKIISLIITNVGESIIEEICKTHKASCKRFLDNTKGITHNIIIKMREDCKQAIKLYEDNGI